MAIIWCQGNCCEPCARISCGKAKTMFPRYEARHLNSVAKENVKSQLTQLLVPTVLPQLFLNSCPF